MSIALALLSAVFALAIAALKWNEVERKNQALVMCSVAAFLLSLGSAVLDGLNRRANAEQIVALRRDAATAAKGATRASQSLNTANSRLAAAELSNAKLRQETAALRVQLDKASQLVANTNKEIENAKGEARKVTDARDQLRRQVESLGKEIEKAGEGVKREGERAINNLFER